MGAHARCVTVILLAAGCLFPVLAADTFYLGTWKIDSAVLAPWADPKYPLDPAERKSLVGKIVVVGAKEITGPRQMACKGPNYRMKDYPADMLFQGAFDEMRRKDQSVDPMKLAQKLGFQGKSSDQTWKTLETGCGNELDFHFVDPATAEFGLNDYVYTLKKQ